MREPSRRAANPLLPTALLALAFVASPALAQDDTFPEAGGEAMRLYEEGFPLEDWASGPVEYIMLEHERDEWSKLSTDQERQAFINWFWLRRDADPRDEEHEFKAAFYGRVASANQRFNGFPRGWRSDRGRVWITLGRPTGGLRRTSLRNYGRCSAEYGEWWTYYTNNMAFQSSFGEFHVIFVETRIGQFEICEPTMMGVGGFPNELRLAFQFTNESAVRDTHTAFDRRAGATRAEVVFRETAATVEPLTVPVESWGLSGVGGAALVPVEMPLRDLFFEPGENTLRASLQVEAELVPLGAAEGTKGLQEWRLELGADDADAIGGGALRTALVLDAEPGGYSARIRITDPLSSTAWTWEGALEIGADGAAVSPAVVGSTLVRLRDGGEVAVLAAQPARIRQGKPFYTVVWLRGLVPAAEDIALSVIDTAGNEVVLEARATWRSGAASGPLVVEATAPEAVPGEYLLRLSVGPDQPPVETRIVLR